MCALLSIPREMRDDIIDYVLHSQATPTDEAKSNHVINEDDFPVVPYTHLHDLYTAYGLLLTNRQLHVETMERLKYLQADPSVDFMWRKATCGDQEVYQLIPTWTNLPVRRNCNTIEVRLFIGEHKSHRSTIHEIELLFLNQLLRDTLTYYPVAQCMSTSKPREDLKGSRTAREIRLNIITGADFPKPGQSLSQSTYQHMEHHLPNLRDPGYRLRILQHYVEKKPRADLYITLLGAVALAVQTPWSLPEYTPHPRLDLEGMTPHGKRGAIPRPNPAKMSSAKAQFHDWGWKLPLLAPMYLDGREMPKRDRYTTIETLLQDVL